MARDEKKSDRKITLIIWRNVIAAVVILSLIVARQSIIQSNLHNSDDLAVMVYYAGNQRAVSQQIVKDVYRLLYDQFANQDILVKSIAVDVDHWSSAQDQLTAGSPEYLPVIEFANQTKDSLASAKEVQDEIHTMILSLLQDIQDPSFDAEGNFDTASLELLSQEYLINMDRVMLLLEEDIISNANRTNTQELVLFFLLVASVMTQIVFIFLPGQKTLYKSFEQVRYLGEHDRLTGLLNQFSFQERIDADIKSNSEKGLALLLLDIDEFSKVLSKPGSFVPDDVLRRTAVVVLSLVRESDYAARLSNDTYAMLLHTSESSELKSFAETVLREISALDIPAAGKITACIGGAKYHKGESMITWLDRADQALRQAKQEGRGRVVCENQIRTNDMTGAIPWSEKWNSGNVDIDEQHKRLVQLGNALITEALPTGDEVKEEQLLTEIVREILNHFVFEEKIMREIDYPELNQHARIHEQLLAKANKMNEEFLKKNLRAGFVFYFFVEEIIVGHISKEDAKFFPYLKKPEGDTTAGSDMEQQTGN